MHVYTTTEARKNIFKIVDTVSDTHEPALIKGKRHSAVLISQEDWESIAETLYLSSIPGMVEKIVKGMNTPIEETVEADDLEW